MKYSIDGLNKGKIIESVEKIKGNTEKEKKSFVLINYLDGTQDAVELTEENLNTIKAIMEDQAVKYAGQKGNKITKARFKQILGTVLGIAGALGLGLIASETTLTPLVLFGMGCCGVGVFYSNIDAIARIKDVKKYELYVNKIKNQLEQYNEIVAKEKTLTHEVENPKMTDILDLDKTSLSNMKRMQTKLERYLDIELGKQKVKTFENSTNK